MGRGAVGDNAAAHCGSLLPRTSGELGAAADVRSSGGCGRGDRISRGARVSSDASAYGMPVETFASRMGLRHELCGRHFVLSPIRSW